MKARNIIICAVIILVVFSILFIYKNEKDVSSSTQTENTQGSESVVANTTID